MDGAQKKYLGAGLVGLAVVLLLVAMFTGWWTVRVESGGSEDEEKVAPFEEGETETVLTGVFALLALLAAIAVAAFVAAHAFDIEALAKWPLSWGVIGAAAVGLLAVVAVVVTATSWPDEDTGAEFWGEDRIAGFSGFGANMPSTTISYMPGAGWWLEMVGAAALVGGTVLAWLGGQEKARRKTH